MKTNIFNNIDLFVIYVVHKGFLILFISIYWKLSAMILCPIYIGIFLHDIKSPSFNYAIILN